MPAAHNPWKFFTGDTWQIETTCTDFDGAALDITGATEIEWKLNDESGLNNILAYALGSGVTITDAVNGKCLVTVPVTITAALTPAIYRDQLRLFIAGTVSVQSFGIITAIADLKAWTAVFPLSGNLVFSPTAPTLS